MAQGLKLDRKKIIGIRKKNKGKLRSISCMVDYRTMPTDQVDRYMSRTTTAVGKARPKRMEEGGGDFSMMIGEGRFGDVSVIHSSGKGRKSYSEWKKQGEVRCDLTVIDEKILC